jgi:hypothetical protein
MHERARFLQFLNIAIARASAEIKHFGAKDTGKVSPKF